MIAHEDKMALRENLYRHGMVLMEKVQKMIDAGNLTQSQMEFAADVMKDIAKMDKSLAKACYYDSIKGDADERKY